MAQIVTLIKNLGSNNSTPKRGYSSHYKGYCVDYKKRFREIYESVLKKRFEANNA
ncbi:hypothetical protein HpHA38_12310 [Helicobacter pylori]